MPSEAAQQSTSNPPTPLERKNPTPQAETASISPRSQESQEETKTEESNNQVESAPSVQNPAPPLPDEPLPPPLPNEKPPEDDGWEPIWNKEVQAYYFYNRFTNATQWENPRVPAETAPGVANHDRIAGAPGVEVPSSTKTTELHPAVRGGYNPAIHGDYDPNADYAQDATLADTSLPPASYDPVTGQLQPGNNTDSYAATAAFNRFTGRFQAPDLNPENHNDDNKSRRQMSAFFDVDAAANNHDGRSLKAERASQKLSKSELKKFKEKRRERKEEKRRAWLKD